VSEPPRPIDDAVSGDSASGGQREINTHGGSYLRNTFATRSTPSGTSTGNRTSGPNLERIPKLNGCPDFAWQNRCKCGPFTSRERRGGQGCGPCFSRLYRGCGCAKRPVGVHRPT
jgi:hypothetical protein